MKLSDYVIEFLADKGIRNMFYLPGGGCMHLTNSLGCCERIHEISLLHEQAVAIACEAYAAVSEEVGAALVTTGPGGTNAVTGVLSAYLDSAPCIFISGQVKTTDLKSQFGVRSLGSQEAGIVEIVESITKYAVMIRDKESVRYHLERAWHEATSGRKGPVWIDIPLDIQGAQIEPDQLKGFEAPEYVGLCKPDEIAQAIIMLNHAKRPVIMTGNGLLYSKNEFYQMADLLGIPVIPSWKFSDLVANDHPLYIGKCGTLGERAANFAMQNADLIMSLGCRLDYSITGYDRGDWAPNAKKIIVEIDKNEIDKLGIGIDLPVICDVKEFIKELIAQKVSLSLQNIDEWKKQIANWQEKYPVIRPEHYEDQNGLSTYAVIAEICKRLDDNALVVPSSAGTVAEITHQALQIRQGQRVRSNHGLGSMGYELPYAIGAQAASGGEVVTVAGDGGIQLNIQELAVIAGRRLPIKIFVISNDGYASIQNMQRNHFQGYYVGSNQTSGLYIPDMAAIGRAYGLKVYEAFRIEEMKAAIEKVLLEKGPVLCVMHVDNMSLVEPRSATQIMPDGTLKSSTLENLYPFLTEEELAENMLGPSM